MFVHQSPRRYSARLQNAYEDGTDEDEQHLLQPADQYDRRRSDYGRPSSPQDQHPRHTQLHTPVRKFADQQSAANDVPFGPYPDASRPAYSAGERCSGTEHADSAYSAGAAALPPSMHRTLPSAPQRPPTPFVQRSSDQVNDRPPLPAGSYYSDSLYPQPTTREARWRLTPRELAPLPLYPEADGQEWQPSHAAEQPTSATSRAEHRYHQQHQRIVPDPGGGRGLSSYTSEPAESYADREQKSAFYRNAAPYKPDLHPHLYAWKPLDLPKFDGDIRKYPRFREAFDQVYGSNPDLPAYLKLLYLRDNLLGEALAFAERYMVTNANYAIVVKQLEEKYGDKDRLGATLVHDLFNVQQPSETLEDLRRFHHEVHVLQSLLKYAGDTWDNHSIATLVATKLPESIRLKLVESYGYRKDNRQTTALLESLNKYAANLAWASTELHLTEKPSDDAPVRHSTAVDTSDLGSLLSCEGPKFTATEPAINGQRVAAAATTTIAEEQLRERRTCPLCGQLHSAADCTVYDTTKKRLRRVQKLKMCILCLREGHPAASCPRRTTHPCKICRLGQHNRALCMVAIDGRQRTVRHPSQVRATKGSNTDPEASDQQRHSRTTAPDGSNRRTAEQSVNRDVTSTVPTATSLRQSGTQSSLGHIHGNLINRKKRSKELGTDPPGRTGTNRPPTPSTDESMKQNGADAYGRDRLLPGRYDLLQMDRCLTKREMLQLDRGHINGSADAEYQHELHDEDIPHQPFDGHRDAVSDWPLDAPDEGRFPHHEESTVYVACASDSEQPAVLHECLAVTALNPVSQKSCRAVIMFDSGSSSSHVSSKLANLLDLPHHEMRVQSVSTFGSMTPMAVNGFRTFLVLRSEHGRSIKVHVTALDCIVSSVRTALVRDAVLPALRRNDCPPTATREMPDLLIGQDLVHLFDRQLEPTLPNGLYIVQTSLGPTIGGAYHSVPQPTESPPAPEPSDDASATPPSMDHTTTKSSAFFNPDDPLNLWTLNDDTPVPAYSAGQEKREPLQDLAYSASPACGDSIVTNASTLLCGDIVTRIINEFLEPSTTLPFSLDRSSSPTQTRSPQKQIFANPLDTLPPLLPTHYITNVEVEEVSVVYLAAGLPRPIQEPLSSAEAELRCSTPPTTTHGDLISASPEDAGSTLQRKTRLRSRLPVCAWQLLGIYTAPESVIAVTLLLPMDSMSTSLPRAERDFQLVLMPSSPSRTIINPPIGAIQSSHALQLLAVLSPDTCGAVLNELFHLIRRQPAATGKPRTFGRTGSRSDLLSLLRSTRGLPTHASEANDQPSLGSAHSRPPALDGHTTDAVGPQSTPQPLATPPGRPPPHRRTRSSPPSILSRVRIDSHPTHPAADDTSHCCLLRPFGPATFQHLSRAQRSRVLAAYVPFKSCFTSSSLATARINMGRRKPKTTAPNDDESSAFPGPTNNFHRTSGPGEAYRKPTVEQLAADHARTELNHDHHMDKQTMDTGHGTTAPAYSAGQAVIPTVAGARKAKPAVPPAYSAGATGDARRNHQQQPAGPDKTARSSSKFCQPPNTKKKKRSSMAKPPKRLAAGRQPTSPISKTAYPSVFPTYSVGTRGYARQDNKTKSAVQAEKASSTPTIRRPSNQRKEKRLPPATAAPSKAKPPATKDSSRPRGHPAHAIASPSGLLSRSVNLSSDIIGHSRDSGLLSQVSRARYSGSTLATKAPRASRLPRGPRADLVDQKLPAPHRCSDAEAVSTTRHQATRATQEPLEPLAVTSPRQCAFCGQLHLSYECHVYTTVSQRLRRAQVLKCCFRCLGQGHPSASCPAKDTITCSLCRRGPHQEAFCHHTAPFAAVAKAIEYASCTAPTISARTAAIPAVSRERPLVPASSKTRRACAFCQSPHWSMKCTAYDSRATTKATDTRANGKKRVNISRVRVNNRNVCPPENETICFCDASTFYQFGRQLRSGVQMTVTPTQTSADATNFVCDYRPTTEVKPVIFWFSSDRASLSHVELVRLVTVLSQYYTTHYETIMQYVVVSPSVSSRQDAWTYGIFKYLVQAEVLLLDARTTMLPHAILVHDANQHQAGDTEQRSETGNLLNSTEDVKHRLREQHQLDLWSHYRADQPLRPVKVAAYSAVTETPSSSSQTEASAYSAPAKVPAPLPNSAPTADQKIASRTSTLRPPPEPKISLRSRQPLRPRPLPTLMPLLLPQPVSIANEATRTATNVAVIKDLLSRLMASTTGPSASSRSPNKDRERNQ